MTLDWWRRLRHDAGPPPLLVLLAAAVLVVQYLAVTRGGPPPTTAAVRNPFAAIAIASIFCRYILHDRRGATRRWIVYLSPLTFIAALAVEGREAPPPLLLLDMLFALGALGTAGFIIAAMAAGNPESKRRHRQQLLDASLLPLAASMVSFGLWATYRINPVYDGRIFQFEEILGVRLPLLVVRSYSGLRPFSAIATACYIALGLAMAVVAARQGSAQRERNFLAATIVAGALGFALYFVCPVVGPLQAFSGSFPDTLPVLPPDAPLLTAASGMPRNGMPSLHTIWVLLIWLNLGTLSTRWKVVLWVFGALTLWAAIGPDGSHWLMDVVVAVPLAVAVHVACISPMSERVARGWRTIAICSSLAGIWIVAFRFAPALLNLPTLVAWAAVVATVCWPLSRLRAVPTAHVVARLTATA